MITRIPVTLTLTAPYATRSSSIGGFGTDLPLAQNGDGKLMLPGSHILGKMVQATRELAALLGEPAGAAFTSDLALLHAAGSQAKTDEAADGREARRNLTASDFILTEAPIGKGTRTRIARDNVTATVVEGMLQVIEAPFAPGTDLHFVGELRLFGPVDCAMLARLQRVLQFVTQFGGLRTVGFGLATAVTFGASVATLPAMAAPQGATLELRLCFADPFCAGEGRNTPNTYISAHFVPGGVIKGAIARQVLAAHGLAGFLDDASVQAVLPPQFHALAANYGDIRFGHATPVLKTGGARRPMALPESLAVVETGEEITIVDLAGLADPSVPVLIAGCAPLARFDWKEKHCAVANTLFDRPDLPDRVLRIRTQIDDTFRAAKAQRLFGIEYTQTEGHDFVAAVNLPDSVDLPVVKNALAEILASGIAGIGRGGAYATAALTQTVLPRTPDPAETRVVLVLQSAALIRTPGSSIVALQPEYQAAFRRIGLPTNWGLTAVFARERLAGGSFMLNRVTLGGKYGPWLLTDPGATFVFDRLADGGDFPLNWLKTGLPVPATVLDFHGIESEKQLYRQCPYLPENGYGEVMAGVPTKRGDVSHKALAPVALGLSVETVRQIAEGGGP